MSGDEETPEPDTPQGPDSDGSDGSNRSDQPVEDPVPPEEAVTFAFIGDQGLRDTSRQVLRLIRSEGAELVVHAGDFDYADDPEAWDAMLTEELGASFPYVAVIGGHDRAAWDGYERVLHERADRADELNWSGSLGLQATITYRDIPLVFVAPDICEDEEDRAAHPELCRRFDNFVDPEEYVDAQLSDSNALWRVCAFHEPDEDFQTGDKGSGADVDLYDVCRDHGALISTADMHGYGRTHLMGSFSEKEIASRSPPFTIGNGRTFNVLSGIGGQSFYEATEKADAEWWASTCSKGDRGTFGAFFATLRTDATGECYFKDIEGRVIDGPFEIESAFRGEAIGP